MWHASAAIQPMKPVARWRRMERQAAERALREVLSGVGLPDVEWREEQERSIHVRRRVTSEEHAFVGPAKDVMGPECVR